VRNEIELMGVLPRTGPARPGRARQPSRASAACQGLCRFEHFPQGLGSAEWI